MKGNARAPGRTSGLRLVAGEDFSVEDYYWLAPGVGPVKATHQESRGEGSTAQSIGFTLELEHLKRSRTRGRFAANSAPGRAQGATRQ